MKRILSIILAVLLIVSLAACGNEYSAPVEHLCRLKLNSVVGVN